MDVARSRADRYVGAPSRAAIGIYAGSVEGAGWSLSTGRI